MEDHKNDLPQTQDEENKNNAPPANKNCFWASVVAFALGALLFGLTFTLLGAYALFASLLSELAALSFLNAQKKRGNFPACKAVKILSYVVLILGVALLIGAAVYKSIT